MQDVEKKSEKKDLPAEAEHISKPSVLQISNAPFTIDVMHQTRKTEDYPATEIRNTDQNSGPRVQNKQALMTS